MQCHQRKVDRISLELDKAINHLRLGFAQAEKDTISIDIHTKNINDIQDSLNKMISVGENSNILRRHQKKLNSLTLQDNLNNFKKLTAPVSVEEQEESDECAAHQRAIENASSRLKESIDHLRLGFVHFERESSKLSAMDEAGSCTESCTESCAESCMENIH